MTPRRLTLLALITRELGDSLAPTWGLHAAYRQLAEAVATKARELAAELANVQAEAVSDPLSPPGAQPR